MIALPDHYEWVLFMAALIAAEIIVISFASLNTIRLRIFDKAFFEKNFPGIAAPEGGYPDMGSGQYAQKLPHDQWFDFNNRQRVHYNFLEQIASNITFILVAGIFYPRFSVICAISMFIGRIIYSIGYIKRGSRGRMVGVIMIDLALLPLIGAAIYGPFAAGGGVNGLVSFLSSK